MEKFELGKVYQGEYRYYRPFMDEEVRLNENRYYPVSVKVIKRTAKTITVEVANGCEIPTNHHYFFKRKFKVYETDFYDGAELTEAGDFRLSSRRLSQISA